MRYHQHAYFHIKETMYIFMCVHWLRYMVICSLLVIIWVVRLSLIIGLQSTMQTLSFFSFLSHYNRVVHNWYPDWTVVTECGLQLTNIDCIYVWVYEIPEEIEKKAWYKWERAKNQLVKVLIFGLCLYDVNVFLFFPKRLTKKAHLFSFPFPWLTELE
jgi:hypothetical protein